MSVGHLAPSLSLEPHRIPRLAGGDAYATFLTGTQALSGENGNFAVFVRQALTQHAYGGYLLDKWRVSSKLTVNVGFRYEFGAAGHGAL